MPVPVSHGTCGIPWDVHGPVIARCLSQCPMVHVGSHGMSSMDQLSRGAFSSVPWYTLDPMACPWTSDREVPTHGTCGIAWDAYVHGPVRANIFFGRGFDFLNSEIHIVFGVQLLELNFAALWKVYRGSETHLQPC